MSFIDNVKNCIGGEGSPEFSSFRLVSFGFNSAYFENVKRIISFSSVQVTLGLKRGEIKVSGEGLYIKKYCAGDVVICGKISKIEKF